MIIIASDKTHEVEAEEALNRAKVDRAKLLASETAAKEASRLKYGVFFLIAAKCFETEVSSSSRTEFVTTISHGKLDFI